MYKKVCALKFALKIDYVSCTNTDFMKLSSHQITYKQMYL